MKNTQTLRQKLHSLLNKYPNLRVNMNQPWSEPYFKEVVWIVNDYINNSGEVAAEDPLREWSNEYRLHLGENQQY